MLAHALLTKKKASDARVKVKEAKAERANDQARKEAIKSRSKWLAEAQVEFNAFIRTRDAYMPCISCGNTKPNVKYNAGHYLSVGAHPELRYNEHNCHKQCEHCNSFLSGNVSAYRPNLIEKIGIANVEELEGPQPSMKYTIDQIKEIKSIYKAKTKELLQKHQD